MNLKKTVGRVVRCFLSPGQERAIRNLQAETKMAFQHRAGVRKIRRMGWTRPEKINLGSGAYLKKGFLNVDLCPEADAMLDLRRPLPFEVDCCDFIFSEHCFEHFDYPHAIGAVLQECRRVLKPGGVLSFSVPETEWPVRDYAGGDQAPYFESCRKLNWHPPENRTRMEHINYHFRQGGDHRFAYDEETARKILAETGFGQIRQREFDPELDSEHRKIGSLFMEAKKVGT